jgi:hypothetical protein
MILSLVTGLIAAMVTLPFVQFDDSDKKYLWVLLVLPAVIVCLHPRVLNPLLNRLFKLVKRPGLDTPLTGRVLIHALAWSFTAWIFNGLQIWFLAEKFGAPAGKTILVALGGYAFAWCVGFVVIIAPAGGGIRDALLAAWLTPVIGGGPALAVMLVSRAVSTVSDLLVAGAAAASRRGGKGVVEGKDRPPAPPETEAVTPVPAASDNGA